MNSKQWIFIPIMLLVAGCQKHDQISTRNLGMILGGDAGGFSVADESRNFIFPEDHGSHPTYRSEWWYLTIPLKSKDEQLYGVQFTLFRQAVSSDSASNGGWGTGQVFMGHLAVTDVSNDRHYSEERMVRGHERLGGVTVFPFSAYIEDWRLASEVDTFSPLELTGSTQDFSVDLVMEQKKPIILQGDEGLSSKGSGHFSYYYSLPRLAAQGYLTIRGERIAVEGHGWLDREWSTSVLDEQYLGWDWFAMHLDDGREVMAFQMRNPDASAGQTYATVVSNNGTTKKYFNNGVRFEVLRESQGWPVEWRIEIADEWFRVKAAVDDQIMDLSIRYWEGLILVDGSSPVIGYMELTGY